MGKQKKTKGSLNARPSARWHGRNKQVGPSKLEQGSTDGPSKVARTVQARYHGRTKQVEAENAYCNVVGSVC